MQSSFRTNKKKQLLSEINVVPYIDVTLILLIIFMITAPIVQQAVTVELPSSPAIDSKKTSQETLSPFVITVNKKGYYKTSESNGDFVKKEELSGIVAAIVARSQLHPDQDFYIQGDRFTDYENVMYIFTLLKANGVEKVSLVTSPESGH